MLGDAEPKREQPSALGARSTGPFCEACGQPLEPDSRFCGDCGAAVEREAPAELRDSDGVLDAPPAVASRLTAPPPATVLEAVTPTAMQADWPPPQGPPIRADVRLPAASSYGDTSYAAPEAKGATAALVLGILGIVVLPLILSIPAIVVGRRAQERARVLPGQPGLGLAKAGYICGIVGTIWGAINVIFWLIIIVALAHAGSPYA